MTKPTEDYTWAINLVAESKQHGEGGSVIVLNKEEPDVATKQSGIPVEGMFPRGFLNYALNAIQVHLDYLYQGEVGDSFITFNTSTTAAEVAARKGGTWVDHGTDTLAGQSVRVFERTA